MTKRYKVRPKRASLEENGIRFAEGGERVVKGVSKRIIEIPSPDPRVFEKAFFIVREDFAGQAGLSDKDILRQAWQAAAGYARSARPPRRGLLERLRPAVYAAAGAALTALAWLTIHMAVPLG